MIKLLPKYGNSLWKTATPGFNGNKAVKAPIFITISKYN